MHFLISDMHFCAFALVPKSNFIIVRPPKLNLVHTNEVISVDQHGDPVANDHLSPPPTPTEVQRIITLLSDCEVCSSNASHPVDGAQKNVSKVYKACLEKFVKLMHNPMAHEKAMCLVPIGVE